MRDRINLRSALGLDDPKYDAQRAEIREQIEVAQKVYNLRTERGLSQAQVAKLGGTTLAVINQMEESDYDLNRALRILETITKALEADSSPTLTPTIAIARPA